MAALCLLGLGKVSLPVSLGGLGLRLASPHAPYSSAYQSSSLVCSILGHSPASSPVLGDVLLVLSSAGNHPDWSSPDALDVPTLNSTSVELLIRHILILCLKTLLTSVAKLLSSLPQFNMLETGCMLSLLHSLVYILKIVSSTYVCTTGLESNLLGKTRSVLYVVVSLILWGNIMSHVEEMLTSFLDITVSVMSFLLLPVQPHCHLGRNC